RAPRVSPRVSLFDSDVPRAALGIRGRAARALLGRSTARNFRTARVGDGLSRGTRTIPITSRPCRIHEEMKLMKHGKKTQNATWLRVARGSIASAALVLLAACGG